MKKIIKNIFKINSSKKSDEEYGFVPNTNPTILVSYQSQEMGYLTYEKEKWFFEYTPSFKSQNDLQPLFEFPDVNKKYENDRLWPFFLSRIPSEKQPVVETYIKKNPKHKGNLIELLKEFGSHSVNNPYTLDTLI
ncbi:HipA N-terminal domain-containing protein [Kordia sp.]|uniref:HipA N-terminal domain-containing protein n=1 Tax=Kordia sp. TaxID=1965332 RepID=UPI003D276269